MRCNCDFCKLCKEENKIIIVRIASWVSWARNFYFRWLLLGAFRICHKIHIELISCMKNLYESIEWSSSPPRQAQGISSSCQLQDEVKNSCQLHIMETHLFIYSCWLIYRGKPLYIWVKGLCISIAIKIGPLWNSNHRKRQVWMELGEVIKGQWRSFLG